MASGSFGNSNNWGLFGSNNANQGGREKMDSEGDEQGQRQSANIQNGNPFGGFGASGMRRSIGTVNVKFNPKRNRENHYIMSITGQSECKDRSLEELRSQDYALLKSNLVSDVLLSKIQRNITYQNNLSFHSSHEAGDQVSQGGLFGSGGSNESTSGRLFGNLTNSQNPSDGLFSGSNSQDSSARHSGSLFSNTQSSQGSGLFSNNQGSGRGSGGGLFGTHRNTSEEESKRGFDEQNQGSNQDKPRDMNANQLFSFISEKYKEPSHSVNMFRNSVSRQTGNVEQKPINDQPEQKSGGSGGLFGNSNINNQTEPTQSSSVFDNSRTTSQTPSSVGGGIFSKNRPSVTNESASAEERKKEEQQTLSGISQSECSNGNGDSDKVGTSNVEYKPSKDREGNLVFAIAGQNECQDRCLEELRMEDYALMQSGKIPDHIQQKIEYNARGQSSANIGQVEQQSEGRGELFGNSKENSQTDPTKKSSLFGNSGPAHQEPPQAGSLFSNKGPSVQTEERDREEQQVSSGGLFGNKPQPIFGEKPESLRSSGLLFGNKLANMGNEQETQQNSGMFSNKAGSTGGGLFGKRQEQGDEEETKKNNDTPEEKEEEVKTQPKEETEAQTKESLNPEVPEKELKSTENTTQDNEKSE